jgi:hypothetical protein
MSLTHTFRSDDAGAPTLAGTAGYLVAVLDACLVNGYNSKTVTITRTGTTATLNCTAHGFRNGQIVVVSGANETDYNITARCTRIDADNISIQVANSPTTPATGTITCKVAPAGWTKAYSGTNKAAYRQPTSGANGFYFRFDDTAATNTQFRGYESMSDVDTGTGPFPTTVQISGSGLYIYKSNTSSTASRRWHIWTNGSLVHLVISQGNSATTFGKTTGVVVSFGDFASFKTGDIYNTLIIGDTGSGAYGNGSSTAVVSGYYGSGPSGHFMCREANQTTASPVFFLADCGAATRTNSTYYYGSSGPGVYPDGIFGGIPMSRALIGEWAGVRGRLPGLWSPHNGQCFHTEDTFSGATGTDIEGRSFEIVLGIWNEYIPLVVETSDTWD